MLVLLTFVRVYCIVLNIMRGFFTYVIGLRITFFGEGYIMINTKIVLVFSGTDSGLL